MEDVLLGFDPERHNSEERLILLFFALKTG
jgi:hypothetical protein